MRNFRWNGTVALTLCLVSACSTERPAFRAGDGGRELPDDIRPPKVELDLRIPTAKDKSGPLLGRVYSGFVRGGRLFIANAASQEVLEYDTAGVFVKRIGRAGQGPGEFQRIRWIAPLQPDSLLVLDSGLRRVTVFDSAGTYARSFSLAMPQAGEPQWIAEYGSGLAFTYSSGVDPRALAEGDIARDSVIVLLIDRDPIRDSVPTAVLPAFPGRWWQRVPETGGYRMRVIEDGASPVVAIHEDVLMAASSDVQEVRRWDGSRWQIVPLRRQSWTNGAVTSAPDARSRLYDGLVVAAEGRFWLGESRPNDRGLRVWRVFDSAGTLVNAAFLPGAFRPWQVESSQVLGRSEAEDGSEQVELLRVRFQKREKGTQAKPRT